MSENVTGEPYCVRKISTKTSLEENVDQLSLPLKKVKKTALIRRNFMYKGEDLQLS